MTAKMAKMVERALNERKEGGKKITKLEIAFAAAVRKPVKDAIKGQKTSYAAA